MRLFKPDENRYTWIKGDLSFLGLKQVVYDPISRVSIQEVNPQNKSPYQTIKRVRFIDGVKGNFTENWISINKDLTTIIGGKSSGKSLLLYFIAKSINCNEVDNVIKLIEGSSYGDLNIDFEVEWDNGTISKLSNIEDTRPITYIPQLYINRLAEVNGKRQLNELIEDIICQNDKYKSFRSNKKNEIINIKSKISELVNLHDIYSQSYISTKNELDKIGVKSSIEGEIKRLNYLVDELRKKSGSA
ncbi:hypothetical protein B4900_03285 [Yersinia rohdei]|nr:hypothetical protein B4900_03285 [Yersinia rohdei]